MAFVTPNLCYGRDSKTTVGLHIPVVIDNFQLIHWMKKKKKRTAILYLAYTIDTHTIVHYVHYAIKVPV